MAFNIDIEVDKCIAAKSIKIYCTLLTNSWDIVRTENELIRFYSALLDKYVMTQNSNPFIIGDCPPITDPSKCEVFLSRLGCTPLILKMKILHEFLNVPDNSRVGLRCVANEEKTTMISSGYLKKHSIFTNRGSVKRWMTLNYIDIAKCYQLDCYIDQTTKISSLRINNFTKLYPTNFQNTPNAFTLKFWNIRWVLEASSISVYKKWIKQLTAISAIDNKHNYKSDYNTMNSGNSHFKNSVDVVSDPDPPPYSHKYQQLTSDKQLIVQLQIDNNKLQNRLETNKKQRMKEHQEFVIKQNEYKQMIEELENKLKETNKKYKKLQLKYDELELKYNDQNNNNKIGYKLWKSNDIANWMININKKDFAQYYNVLKDNLFNESIDGSCLDILDTSDLHRLGTTHFKHKKVILQHIGELIAQNNNDLQNDQNEGTAYL